MANDGVAWRGAGRGRRVEKQKGGRAKRGKDERRMCDDGKGRHDPDADTAIDEAKKRENGDARVMLKKPGKARTQEKAAHDIGHLTTNGMLAIDIRT